MSNASEAMIAGILRIRELDKEVADLQAKYATLKASHDRLEGVIQGALRIEDLWLINEPVNDQHIGVAEALARMKLEFDQALKDAEKIK